MNDAEFYPSATIVASIINDLALNIQILIFYTSYFNAGTRQPKVEEPVIIAVE